MTLYTAVGRYEFRKTGKGDKLPVIIAEGQEHTPDIWEMILWSSLIWNIHTHEEITEIFYRKEREAHVLGELSCDHYLDKLEQKGLIVSGHGITAADALHDLLSRLYIIPVRTGIAAKTAAFLHLTFVRRFSLKVTRHIFDRPDFSEQEKRILRLTGQARLSVGELIKCVECSIVDVSTNEKLMDALYDDADTTYRNIGFLYRTCDAADPVLEAVAALYLKRHILFEK